MSFETARDERLHGTPPVVGAGNRIRWPWLGLALAAVLVLVTDAWVACTLGWTTEEHIWQGAFQRLAATDWSGIWRQGAGTYRPLCGSFLYLQDVWHWPVWARYLLSNALHWANLGLLGALVVRLRGWGAGAVAFGLAAVWSSDAEVTLWLGARCDVLMGLFALLGSHAVVSGARATSAARVLGWVLLATCATVLACLAKESGWSLPVVWAPLSLRHGRVRWELLWAPAMAVVATIALRRWTLGGLLGPYIGSYLPAGPVQLARSLVRALGQLGIGDAVADWHSLLIVGAVLMAGLAAITWRAAPRSRTRMLVALGVIALLGPASVRVAPRTLYPVVLVLSCCLGLVWPALRERRWACWALGGFALWQAGSSLAVARQWSRAHVERTQACALLQRELAWHAPLVVLGARSRFQRRWLGEPGVKDLAEPGLLGGVCTPHPNEHYDFADSCDGYATLLIHGELQDEGECTWRFALRDYACERWSLELGPLSVEPHDQARSMRLALRAGGSVTALWRDVRGNVHRQKLMCPSTPRRLDR